MQVARDLLQNSHYLYVGFLCHQATEKLLKAYWCKVKEEKPIKIHTLIRLATLTGLWSLLDDTQKQFIGLLEPLNIAGRYPDYKSNLVRMLNQERTSELLKRTINFHKWIETKL